MCKYGNLCYRKHHIIREGRMELDQDELLGEEISVLIKITDAKIFTLTLNTSNTLEDIIELSKKRVKCFPLDFFIIF